MALTYSQIQDLTCEDLLTIVAYKLELQPTNGFAWDAIADPRWYRYRIWFYLRPFLGTDPIESGPRYVVCLHAGTWVGEQDIAAQALSDAELEDSYPSPWDAMRAAVAEWSGATP